MAGLTDRDLRRIKRFVETPPRQRTPHILTPDEESEALDESEGRPTSPVTDDADTEAETETDVEAAG